MKVLYLTLKSKWFDSMASGDKLEEYREIKPFWIKRLCNDHPGCIGGELQDKHKVTAYTFRDFTHVTFARGGHFHHSLPQMTLECKGIEIRTGNPIWGAEPNREYFVIKLGEIIKSLP